MYFYLQKFYKGGNEHAQFKCNCPIGKNAMLEYMRDGACIMGFKNWQEFIPHSLRGYFVTQMANSKDVSNVERMRSTRHMNPATSAAYQSRSSVTEAAKFVALGIQPPPPPTTTTKTILFEEEKKKVSAPTAYTTTVLEKFPTPKNTTTTKSEGQGSLSTARTTTVLETFPVTSIPSRPSSTNTTTSSPTANIVSGFQVRGGGLDDTKCSKVSVVSDQYEDKDFDDEMFPHTQLAMEECNHDIKQLQSTLESGGRKPSTGISTTAICVQKMAGKVRELTKLVKSLNEKVVMYEDMLYNAGLKECKDLITTATTTTGRKRNFLAPKQLFSPVNTPNHHQTTTPTVTNPYQQTAPINPYRRCCVTPPQ